MVIQNILQYFNILFETYETSNAGYVSPLKRGLKGIEAWKVVEEFHEPSEIITHSVATKYN